MQAFAIESRTPHYTPICRIAYALKVQSLHITGDRIGNLCTYLFDHIHISTGGNHFYFVFRQKSADIPETPFRSIVHQTAVSIVFLPVIGFWP